MMISRALGLVMLALAVFPPAIVSAATAITLKDVIAAANKEAVLEFYAPSQWKNEAPGA